MVGKSARSVGFSVKGAVNVVESLSVFVHPGIFVAECIVKRAAYLVPPAVLGEAFVPVVRIKHLRLRKAEDLG